MITGMAAVLPLVSQRRGSYVRAAGNGREAMELAPCRDPSDLNRVKLEEFRIDCIETVEACAGLLPKVEVVS